MSENKQIKQIDYTDAPSQLFETLNRSGVRYCNWKSSIHIPEGIQGRTDLDLLVDPRDTAAFQEILQEYDLKHMRPAAGKVYPGIENYLGFDRSTGRLFHLHVHYQLVLGEQFVKNYHLPIEEAFLDKTILRHGIKAPRPEVEIIVLCLRALLKYRDRDAIKDMLPMLHWLGKKGGLPKQITNEIRWLLGQTSLEQVDEQLNRWQGILPGDAVRGLLSLVSRKEPAGLRLWQYRRMVRHALRGYQRRDRLSASLSYFREEWRRKRRIFKPANEKKLTFTENGLRIAFVGVDGSGKSTVTSRIAKWLSWRASVGVFYMGKTHATLPVLAIQPFIKLARKAYGFSTRRFGEQSVPAKIAHGPKDALENIFALLQGRARLRAYRESRRRADEGAIVLYDRYPLQTVRIDNHTLDGPSIFVYSDWMNRLHTRLARAEARVYRKIQPPDHVIFLQVSAAISQKRRTEANGANLATKANAINKIKPDGFALTVIQAEQPLEDVLAQVKPVLWKLL